MPTNKVKNQQYITQLVTNIINAELQYSPEVQQVTKNSNGTVMVNTLTLTYESKVTPAFVPNFNKIPYGGYMHTMFNNKLLQLVNYTNCEKLWQIAFINNGQLGIFNG